VDKKICDDYDFTTDASDGEHVPTSILATTCKHGSDEDASMSGTLPSNRSEDNDFLGSSDEDTSGPQKGKYNVVFKRGNIFIYLEVMSIVKSN
jgi:hypothetical protein